MVSYRLNIVMSCLKKIQPSNHCLFFKAFIFNLITVMLGLNLLLVVLFYLPHLFLVPFFLLFSFFIFTVGLLVTLFSFFKIALRQFKYISLTIIIYIEIILHYIIHSVRYFQEYIFIRKLWYLYTMEYYSAIKNVFESVLMR